MFRKLTQIIPQSKTVARCIVRVPALPVSLRSTINVRSIHTIQSNAGIQAHSKTSLFSKTNEISNKRNYYYPTFTPGDHTYKNLSAQEVKTICAKLKEDKKLYNLYFENFNDDKDHTATKAIVDLIKTHKGLKALKIDNKDTKGICDAGAKLIAEAIPNNRTLIDLYIPNNQIGSEGANALADVLLTYRHSLKFLHMQGNNHIGKDSAPKLYQLLKDKIIENMNVNPETTKYIEEEIAHDGLYAQRRF